MAIRIRSAILAPCLLAGLTVGLAGAAVFHDRAWAPKAEKGDLPAIPKSRDRYVTFETRENGVSVLTRVKQSSEALELQAQGALKDDEG